MHREQIHPCVRGTAAAWWFSLLLPALVVASLLLTGPLAALAATASGGQQAAEQQAAEQQSSRHEHEPVLARESEASSDPTDSENDSDDKGEAEPEHKPGHEEDIEKAADENQAADQSDQEAKAEGEASSPEDEPEGPQETPQRKPPADSPPAASSKPQPSEQAAVAEGEGQASGAQARAEEVDLSQSASPKNDEKSNRSKKVAKQEKCVIGATATLLEKRSELKFRARVDSGAKSCSLHVEKIKIEDESEKEDIAARMTENIGKVIHFEVKNGDGKTHILTSKIAGYVIIKTSDRNGGKRRYKVPLTFRWKSMEKEVLVTLNNRNHMEYPLLLGRNFLRGDFLVDVELDSDD